MAAAKVHRQAPQILEVHYCLLQAAGSRPRDTLGKVKKVTFATSTKLIGFPPANAYRLRIHHRPHVGQRTAVHVPEPIQARVIVRNHVIGAWARSKRRVKGRRRS
jgi:hypothetical protein